MLHEGKNLVILKGAPEMVVSRCAGYMSGGEAKKMTPAAAKRLLDEAAQLSRESMTVYAVAAGVTDCDSLKKIDAEKRLLFRGFIGLLYVGLCGRGLGGVQMRAGRHRAGGADGRILLQRGQPRQKRRHHHRRVAGHHRRAASRDGRGPYIANSPDYKVYRGVTDAEWLRVLRLRKETARPSPSQPSGWRT